MSDKAMTDEELADEYDRLKAEEMILSTKLAVKVDQRLRLMAQNDALRAQLTAAQTLAAAWSAMSPEDRDRIARASSEDFVGLLYRVARAVERGGA